MFIPLCSLSEIFIVITFSDISYSKYYPVPCRCREEFKLYLGRPDMRQELVTQWQKDFNSISDDMRDDEDTKAELHLRLDVRGIWDLLQYKYS